MKILVTGGSGFLGSNLKEQLDKTNHYVKYLSRKDANLLSYEETVKVCSPTRNVMKRNGKFTRAVEKDLTSYDIILHAGANCGGIGLNDRMPATLGHDNVLMGLNILKAAVECKIPQVYMVGSCCSYGEKTPIPMKEDDLFSGGAEQKTNQAYGSGKKFLFTLFDAYKKQYGLKGGKFILGNLYGPHDHFDLENSHVIPALINKIVNAKTNNLPEVYCWGSGNPTREFVYAADASEFLIKAIDDKFDNILPVNVGNGVEISINDLVYIIAELCEYNGKIIFDGSVSDGQPRRCLDVSRAKELLNWSAKTDLKTGLIKTIEWYKLNKLQ